MKANKQTKQILGPPNLSSQLFIRRLLHLARLQHIRLRPARERKIVNSRPLRSSAITNRARDPTRAEYEVTLQLSNQASDDDDDDAAAAAQADPRGALVRVDTDERVGGHVPQRHGRDRAHGLLGRPAQPPVWTRDVGCTDRCAEPAEEDDDEDGEGALVWISDVG